MTCCTTCPHSCCLSEGSFGLCRSRVGRDDRVVPEGYGRLTSLALDPIEKKPIARWRSGTTVLSLGSYGCNMRCPFCQSASIAQAGPDDVPWREVAPAEVVDTALSLRDRRCIGIAYTYNEPLVNWEFLRDTGRLAHEAGLVNVLVSNGMASPDVLDEVAPLIDAANIDLKCFTDEGYRSLGGDLATVMHTIETLAAAPSCHLEVTTLVVPGFSDDDAQIDAAARWLASLGAGEGSCARSAISENLKSIRADEPSITDISAKPIVYHLTRFFPQHRMLDVPPTPRATLDRLRTVAERHLDTVLLGNV